MAGYIGHRGIGHRLEEVIFLDQFGKVYQGEGDNN